MKAKHYLLILLVYVFILSSCSKGTTGPVGLTGAQGPQGTTSPFAYAIDSISPSQWSSSSPYTFTINTPPLSSPNSSVVEVYYSNSPSLNPINAQWYELPCPGLAPTDFIQFYYSTYNTTIQYYSTASAPTQKLYFKIVVIANP